MPSTANLLAEIGDAVAAEIVTFNLSTPTTAPAVVERALVPSYDLEELGTEIKIPVVARTENRTRLTRGGIIQRDVFVEVGVLFRVDGDENIDPDSILLLVDEIAAGLEAASVSGTALATYPDAKLIEIKRPEPAYNPEDYREKNLISSGLEATYRVIEGP